MDKVVPVLYYGSEKPLPAVLQLRAGQLSMIYENGALRYIRHGRVEIIRMIHPAIRDHNWGTAIPEVIEEQYDIEETRFEIALKYRYVHHQIDFTASYHISGKPDGTVIFTMQGRANSTFLKNRIGLCVLHPLKECVGREAVITHPGRKTSIAEFPLHVSPHQPMKNISGLSWEVPASFQARLDFKGDIFEMEDHRNWTDASFKIYSTPLELHFPVKVNKGDTMEQQVKLTVRCSAHNKEISGYNPFATIDFGHPGLRVPSLGIAAILPDKLSLEQQYRIRNLGFDHYRLEINLFNKDWKEVIAEKANEANRLELPLELVLHTSSNFENELHAFAALVSQFHPRISKFILFQNNHKTTPGHLIMAARMILKNLDPDIRIGGGTNAWFTELNRERPDPALLNFITFSVNPQVHAADNRSITETLEAQQWVVKSAKEYFHKLPVHVSPVTLKPRFNPNATAEENNPEPGKLPRKYDVRQMSLFAAAWTLGSIKALSEAGASSVTFYETTGPGGLMDSPQVDSYRDVFRAEKNSLYPVYHLFRKVLEMKHGHILPAKSPYPLSWDLMVMKKEKHIRIFVTNYTNLVQNTEIHLRKPGCSIQYINENIGRDFLFNPNALSDIKSWLTITGKTTRISLKPYALVIADAFTD